MSQHIWTILPSLLQADFFGAISEPADVVITCSYLSEGPSLLGDLIGKRAVHVMFPFLDEAKLPDLDYLAQVTEMAWRCWNDGHKVLVNCNAGCNRSGLVIGRILTRDGKSGIVEYIKNAHPEALSNQCFVDYLNSF